MLKIGIRYSIKIYANHPGKVCTDWRRSVDKNPNAIAPGFLYILLFGIVNNEIEIFPKK
jgi:hypothetical protein